MIDIDKLEMIVNGRVRERTHYQECHLIPDHRDCAILMMVRELRALRELSHIAETLLVDIRDNLAFYNEKRCVVRLREALASAKTSLETTDA